MSRRNITMQDYTFEDMFTFRLGVEQELRYEKVICIMLCILSSSLLAVTFDCLDDANVNFYQYTLGVSQGDNVSSVILGTHDGEITNYSNWEVPQGWSYSIQAGTTDDAAYDVHYTTVSPT
jgi:hypothetical protein